MRFSHEFFICLFLILIDLWFIDLFTSVRYDRSSGNGNPAIPFILAYIILLIWFFKILFPKLIVLRKRPFYTIFLSVLSIIIITYGVIYQINRYREIESIHYTLYDDLEFINQRLTGVNIFTNTIYFSYVTFLIMLAIFFLCSTLLICIKRKINFKI